MSNHPFDISDADELGRRDALEGDGGPMDYKTFHEHTGKPFDAEYLDNGVDSIAFAHQVYMDAYRSA